MGTRVMGRGMTSTKNTGFSRCIHEMIAAGGRISAAKPLSRRPFARAHALRSYRDSVHLADVVKDGRRSGRRGVDTSGAMLLGSPGLSVATPALSVVLGAASLLAAPSLSLAIQMEPANALSLPTWAIHVSSVVEWVTAMGLAWKYADVVGNPLWKGLTWGMLPSLGSAMCACTWHFFFNSPDLEFLVALQAFLTVVGNTTCMWAAYRLWRGAQAETS
ncbi:hypothetical protein QJQ45_020080 [Haematococcus lacustris]|nr:hypothetical protein QJQ45_020080 [Haematococcus lacustris]